MQKVLYIFKRKNSRLFPFSIKNRKKRYILSKIKKNKFSLKLKIAFIIKKIYLEKKKTKCVNTEHNTAMSVTDFYYFFVSNRCYIGRFVC